MSKLFILVVLAIGAKADVPEFMEDRNLAATCDADAVKKDCANRCCQCVAKPAEAVCVGYCKNKDCMKHLTECCGTGAAAANNALANALGGAVAAACFSGDMQVMTESGSTQMSNLRIGDLVKTSSGMETVLGFTHADPNAEATFVKIQHDNGHLEITNSHMVAMADGSFIRADAVKPESRLASEQMVRSVETIRAKGVYSPKTASGTIIVNDVMASVHSQKATALSHHYTTLLWTLVNYGSQYLQTPPPPMDIAKFMTAMISA